MFGVIEARAVVVSVKSILTETIPLIAVRMPNGLSSRMWSFIYGSNLLSY